MRVLVVADGHYYKTKDGSYYSQGIYGYSFFKRYLSVFDEVVVASRVETVNKLPEKCKEASGDKLSFIELPNNTSRFDYFKYKNIVAKILKANREKYDCAVLRTPSFLSFHAYAFLKQVGVEVGVEVVVDPWEYFAPGTIKGLSRPIVRYVWTKDLRGICKNVNCVSYVTEHGICKKNDVLYR